MQGAGHDFAINLAASLAYSVMTAAAAHLKTFALGDEEQQALRAVYEEAFAGMLQAVAADLETRDRDLLDSLMRAFVADGAVAERLVDLALSREEPPLGELTRAFEAQGYDAETLAWVVPFDTLLTALLQALEVAIRAEASRPGSPLTNRLVVRGLVGLLDEVRRGRQEILAAVAQGQDETQRVLQDLQVRVEELSHVVTVARGENRAADELGVRYGLTADEILALIRALAPDAYAALQQRTPLVVSRYARPVSQPRQALLEAIRATAGVVALPAVQVRMLLQHPPVDLTDYHLQRIAAWSQPKYQLDTRFVSLTLLLDRGEEAQGERWVQPERARRFHDLREALAELPASPALVLLGAPGSGKSTLLRRLQLDHSLARLRQGDTTHLSFYVSLNGYGSAAGQPLPSPLEWLAERWRMEAPALPPLRELLAHGRLLLLLDGLNEMPHRSAADYGDKVGSWRQFLLAHIANGRGNRAIFSCRTLDYSAPLSGPELRVPQVVAQPMSREQMQQFLYAYLPDLAEEVWGKLEGTRQFDLYRNPYFLRLLTEQIRATHEVPAGQAGLFTGFVREVLRREVARGHRHLRPDTLFTERDVAKIARGGWRTPFELPERGALIPRLSDLAFEMQARGPGTAAAQVVLAYDEARRLLGHERAADILQVGCDLGLLDEDRYGEEVRFFHQLLQEYFAARRLALAPEPELVRVAWRVDEVRPSLEETLASLADSDPLPPLPTTGWEETTVLAAALATDPAAFIEGVRAANLPLAARCAANPEVSLPTALECELQQALLARSRDRAADLRARIAAGEALGLLGDPRFERRHGPDGDYLWPPLVPIPGGDYPIGSEEGDDDERPPHTVALAAFQIGRFPVTNAEYKLFMDAGGYEDERWWETPAARAWLRGEGSAEGQRQARRDLWQMLQDWDDAELRAGVPERWTSEQAERYIWFRDLDAAALEATLAEWFPEGVVYRQPAYWDDGRFNNPAQPVVGVTWFEARAYCAWLTAQVRDTGGPVFRLPTEVEWEAAARGREGRRYACGPTFDPAAQGNTFGSHIRRTTPVGIFPAGVTPEGVSDMTGNVWEWTSTRYDPERFPYPYRADDEREDRAAGGYRVLRGGSWGFNHHPARAAYRLGVIPVNRSGDLGFRVACSYLKK